MLLVLTATNRQLSILGWIKITFGINWLAQAEHSGFYQAMSTTGCAYASGIYEDYGLNVTIKMGSPQVLSGIQ
ncbi:MULTISPECIES: hypothetical protein [unclassified Nostoc]|uniref:hypothetical protein n=1 Tax=unclassified Nostoc TaxID=2593658 RepID=UPI002AD24FE5|nr:hypothetical protein [Nostoc sp. DedQUE03]MDZ7977390.1 hypothetical protein [Nostoc sp. DedQUE03]MDZ8045960.1 hypothetical protein [Nostoc sp. DedQUE02]